MKIWTCKVGEVDPAKLPHGSDGPMRQAVHDAYEALVGEAPLFIFSGWGGTLNEPERAFLEEREPHGGDVNQDLLWSTTDAGVWAEEFAKVQPDVDEGLMIGWFANAMETAKRIAISEAADQPA